MTVDTLNEVLSETANFPNLQVFSICRAPELQYTHLDSFSKIVDSLMYLRISDCEHIRVRLGGKIKCMFRGTEIKIE